MVQVSHIIDAEKKHRAARRTKDGVILHTMQVCITNDDGSVSYAKGVTCAPHPKTGEVVIILDKG